MNTNQIKHYGKNIDQLNELERQLLVVDGLMLIDFHTKAIKGGFLNQSFSESLGRKRTKLVCLLMGVSFEELEMSEGIIQFLEECETTLYGFGKFMKDLDRNIKIQKQMEEIVSMN
jgi:hypothetical protein